MLKQIVLILTITLRVVACDGDCVKCHPTLMKSGSLDNNHKILSKCINCHKITSNDLERMGSLCGQDCWECHSVNKVMSIKNKEHEALNKCIDCHVKLYKNNLFQQKENLYDLIK
jgi:hypothetical protein